MVQSIGNGIGVPEYYTLLQVVKFPGVLAEAAEGGGGHKGQAEKGLCGGLGLELMMCARQSSEMCPMCAIEKIIIKYSLHVSSTYVHSAR